MGKTKKLMYTNRILSMFVVVFVVSAVAMIGIAAACHGGIIVEKQTNPDGALDSFTFTGDVAGGIKDGEQIMEKWLRMGTYTSTETVPAGWVLTDIVCDCTGSGTGSGDLNTKTATFTLKKNEDVVKCIFYNELQMLDFGDVPDSYGTLRASDGARHVIVSDYYLGQVVDEESDGQPSSADGDDNNVDDDEDGVTLPSVLTLGDSAATVIVDVGPFGGQLDAWIDFNGNGVFDHPDEQIFASKYVDGGSNSLPFQVPADATTGTTYARFRLSSAGGLLPTGFAPDGEVEDYMVKIENTEIPEFSTIALPVVAILGLMFFFNHRKRRRD